MNHSSVGKLERVHLREVWKHEASDFTQWLEQNIDVLNNALDLNLVNADREQPAGAFSVDLIAEDEGGGTVIIENQLEKSNHDHLGKLITYLTAMNARTAIWIVADPRPEHVAAITWLNEAGNASFYMVKVEAVKIGNSPAAPLLTLIVGPSEEAETVGHAKKEMAERYEERRRWWKELIERSSATTKLHSHLTPGKYSWLGTSSGVRGVNFNYIVIQDQCAAEVYIDRGKNAEEENLAIFEQLYAHKEEIERAFGGPLSWERLEERRACRIKTWVRSGGYRSPEDNWQTIQDEVINAMTRLEKAVRPFLKKLNLRSDTQQDP
jgi:hypothetical protein